MMFPEGHISFTLSGPREARAGPSSSNGEFSWQEIWTDSLSFRSAETFSSLLHLKTGSASSLFVFVSQECESSIKRLINLEARRQSRPRSRSSAWDREESGWETKREEIKRKMKWIGVRDAKGFLNEGQSLKTFCAQFVFFSPGVVFATPTPRSLPL